MANLFADHLPALRLHIYVEGLPPARDGGRIIERLNLAYGDYRKGRPRGSRRPELHIRRVEISSLIVDLVSLADAIFSFHEHRDLLGGFVGSLADALNYMQGLPAKRGRKATAPPPAARNAIDAMVSAVAHKRAKQVVLNVSGDNNNIIIIDNSVAAAVRTNSPRDLRARPDRDVPQHRIGELRSLSRANMSRLAETIGPQSVDLGSAKGILLHTEGTWYASLEGMNGALLPVAPESIGPGIIPGVKYHTEGQLLMMGSTPIGFVPTIIHTLE